MGKKRSLKKIVRTPIIVDDTAERAERRANRLKKVCDPLDCEYDRSCYYLSSSTLTRKQINGLRNAIRTRSWNYLFQVTVLPLPKIKSTLTLTAPRSFGSSAFLMLRMKSTCIRHFLVIPSMRPTSATNVLRSASAAKFFSANLWRWPFSGSKQSSNGSASAFRQRVAALGPSHRVGTRSWIWWFRKSQRIFRLLGIPQIARDSRSSRKLLQILSLVSQRSNVGKGLWPIRPQSNSARPSHRKNFSENILAYAYDTRLVYSSICGPYKICNS